MFIFILWPRLNFIDLTIYMLLHDKYITMLKNNTLLIYYVCVINL
jgi:hypothetical protein